MTVCEETFFFSIRSHQIPQGRVCQAEARSRVHPCLFCQTWAPWPSPRETRGEAAGPAARPRDGPPCGEAEPKRGRPGRSLRGEEAGRALLRLRPSLRSPLSPAGPRAVLPLPGTPGLPVDQKPSPPASVLPFLQNSSYLPTHLPTYLHSPSWSILFFLSMLLNPVCPGMAYVDDSLTMGTSDPSYLVTQGARERSQRRLLGTP